MHHLQTLETVGRTPMLELRRLSPSPDVRLFAKLEGWNPTGSVKDRIVKHMLQHAEREGRIAPGDTVPRAHRHAGERVSGDPACARGVWRGPALGAGRRRRDGRDGGRAADG